ncbi:hypothetical protein ACFXI0_24460 [Kitasatospora indigofera]|uniref:hypothetical protein n=1 Tax=Kitasatospora indigofera TaxID=67307 RepID=UPI003673D299
MEPRTTPATARDAGRKQLPAGPGPTTSRKPQITAARAVFHLHPSVAEALAAQEG